MDGYEIVADAKDDDSGESMAVYQTILYDVNSYYLLVGLISERNSDNYLKDFAEMTLSFKKK